MLVKKLTLKNFRNHSYLSYDFVPGMNILVGPNTAGKTNVAESIYYLSIAKSFRTDEDKVICDFSFFSSTYTFKQHKEYLSQEKTVKEDNPIVIEEDSEMIDIPIDFDWLLRLCCCE